MKPPISVDNRGDTNTFASVEEAESYMEPIDVERGEYVVTDADGQTLAVGVIVEEMSLLWGLWKGRIKKVRIGVQPGRLD